jgi:putative inorganic carbon (hco3(-)) transporter
MVGKVWTGRGTSLNQQMLQVDGQRAVLVRAVVATCVGAAAGLALAWLLAGGFSLESETSLFVIAGPVGIVLGLVAVTRFEWFVWIVLLVRPSLDVAQSVGLGPGAMLAVVFMVTSIVWLVVQFRSGEWSPISTATRFLMLFGGAALVSMVTSVVRVASAEAVLEIYAGLTMFMVLEQLLPGRPDRQRRLVTVVLCSAIVPSLAGLRQYATGQGISVWSDVTRVYGTFTHPNPFATYLVMILVLAVSVAMVSVGRRRIALAALIALIGVNILATNARSAWAALLVSLAYVGFRLSKRLLAALVAGAVMVVLFVPSVGARLSDLNDDRWVPEGVPANSLEWRMQYWEQLIPLANESPLTGLGPQVILATRSEGLEPHNVFVQTYVEMGLFGLFALLAAIVSIGLALSARRRLAANDFDAALAVGAIAVMISILVQAPSENLLNQTLTWWYVAACATWGYLGAKTPGQAIDVVESDAIMFVHHGTTDGGAIYGESSDQREEKHGG